MSKVDDYGRFHGSLMLILAACYPAQLDRISLADVGGWLAECCQMTASGGQMTALCAHYVVGGKEYIQINNFNQRTRADSKYPAPEDGVVADFGGQMTASGGHLRLARAHSESESYAYSESKTEAHAKSETVARANGIEGSFPQKPRDVKPASFTAWFLRWVAITHLQQHEEDAMRAWIGVVDEERVESVMACLERYGKSDQVARGVVMNPQTWLYEQARDNWRGDWPPPRAPSGGSKSELLEMAKRKRI